MAESVITSFENTVPGRKKTRSFCFLSHSLVVARRDLQLVYTASLFYLYNAFTFAVVMATTKKEYIT